MLPFSRKSVLANETKKICALKTPNVQLATLDKNSLRNMVNKQCGTTGGLLFNDEHPSFICCGFQGRCCLKVQNIRIRAVGFAMFMFLARMWSDLPRTTFSNRVNSLYTNTGYVSIYANRG